MYAKQAAQLRCHPAWRDVHCSAAAVEARVEVAQIFARAGKRLTGREYRVLVARFGLDHQGARTLQEVGDELGLSKERVRGLEWRALKRMRSAAWPRLRVPEEILPVDPKWEAKPRPAPRPASAMPRFGPYAGPGPLELICDGCLVRWRSQMWHWGGRIPLARVEVVRALGRWRGWSCGGGDLCPKCSVPAWTIPADGGKMGRVARPRR